MKRKTAGVTLLALLPLCLCCACSEPERHVAQISLRNDLGTEATLELCKDDLHCASSSELWPQKQIPALSSLGVTVSNEETTVFRISSVAQGSRIVRCLRIRPDLLKQGLHELALSAATGC